MSQAAARAFITEAILSNEKWKASANVRKTMDNMVQSLNISYSVFFANNNALGNAKVSTSELSYNYKIFYALIKLRVPTAFKSLAAAADSINKGILNRECIIVHDSGNVFLMGSSNRQVSTIIKDVSKHPSFRGTSLGLRPNKVDPETGEVYSFVRNLELGHTGEQTPFVETLKSIISYTENDKTYVSLQTELRQVLDNLISSQAYLKYTYLNTSDNTALGTGVINLVIQPYQLNAKFSVYESAAYRQVVNSIVNSLDIANIPGSNTLAQDGAQFIFDKILSVLSGKKIQSIKKHAPVKDIIALPKAAKNNKSTVSTYKDTSPQIKTVGGAAYSLTSLQNLINKHLQDVISANMGDGNSGNVLNYRTGRLASSAKVERMSQSREGMITAFYSYMKNPYATFSEGGRQGSPKSRDPKLLISKSIREIAAERVANRMRAVAL